MATVTANFSLRALSASALAACLACAHHQAHPAVSARAEVPPAALRISPERVLAPVNPGVLRGFNFGNWVQVVDFQDELRALGPAQFRFPGGNIGDERDLTGYALDVFKGNLTVLGAAGAPVTIQTRVWDGNMAISHEPARNGPEAAADDVRWARERGLKVAYWEIGNEPDLFAAPRGDPSWTVERYCQVFRAQAAAIKAVDPSARVAGPGVSGGVPGRDKFVARFVELCGDVVDVLTWHIYPTDGTRSDEAAFATIAEVDQTISRFSKLLSDPATNPLGHGRRIGLGVTEYALSWQTPRMHHLADAVNGLWSAEAALRFNEQGLEVAHYFCLQGIGGHGLIDQGGEERPTYHAFSMLAKLAGQLVAAGSDDPDLWVHAALDGKRLDVIVSNHSAAEKALATGLAGWRLQGGDWFDEGVVRDARATPAISPSPTLRLAPRSMTHLVYERD